MDRFYTSPELFDELKKLNIGACVNNNLISLIKISGDHIMEKIKWYDKGIKN